MMKSKIKFCGKIAEPYLKIEIGVRQVITFKANLE